MAEIDIAVGAVVVDAGRLLVVQRAHDPGRGLWAIPGGRVEVGETLAAATVRELREETGLVGRVTGLCGIAERIGDGHHLVIHDHWVDVGRPVEPVAGDDADDVALATRGDLAQLPLVPLLREFLVEHGVWEQLDP